MSHMPPQPPSVHHPLVPVVVAAIVALLVGAYGGVLFQKRIDDVTIAGKDSVIVGMQNTIASLQASQLSVATSTAASSPQSPLITVFSLPKDADRLCRDNRTTFTWKADAKRVDEVRISINAPFPASPIADVPVSYNETGVIGQGTVNWKIGDAVMGTSHFAIPDGDLYRIHIDALRNGAVVDSQDSGTFAIDTCRG